MTIKEIKITKKQKNVLEKINRFIAENSYPPTVRDLAHDLGFSSPKAVTDHLDSLKKKGYIVRNSLARSIKLTGKALSILGRGRASIGSTGSLISTAGVGSIDPLNRNILYLPLIGRVAAGKPILAEENINEYIPVTSSLLKKRTADFALRVKGDSMVGDHILDGDIIIVKSQKTAENGDIVVALIGDEAVVKRLYRAKGTVELRSSNPSYLPIRIKAAGSKNGSVNYDTGSMNVIGNISDEPGSILAIQGKVLAVQRTIQ
jgi:repressor LexA